MNADELLVKVNDFLSKLRYDRKPSGLYDPVKYVLSMDKVDFSRDGMVHKNIIDFLLKDTNK